VCVHCVCVRIVCVCVCVRVCAGTPGFPITEHGVRLNLDIALRYLASWLRGVGCVPIHNLMEDLATAEISRAQVRETADI